MENIEKILSSLEQPMVETLREWLKFPSVKEAAVEGAPFGKPINEALTAALKTCESLGLRTENVDGYVGLADLGEGETRDALAILGHLDVVPVGDGWTVPPFEGLVRDGRVYGRGSTDDKGPMAAALYAMAAVKAAGVPLKRKVRLILGTDEESGFADMKYLSDHREMPRRGFSPDADYPVINIEKGGMHVELRGALSTDGLQVISFCVGERTNVVPGRASALVKGGESLADKINAMKFDFPVSAKLEDGAVRIDTTGIPGHAAMPDSARNAIGQMLLVLDAAGVKGALHTLAEKLGTDYWGENLGIQMEDRISGKLTVNIGIIRADANGIYATLDLRCPVLMDIEGAFALLKANLPGMEVTLHSSHGPHHVPENSELVQSLLKAYTEVTGQEGRAMAIGGGTYAKCLEEGVAFGALFPGEKELAHQADEFIMIDDLKKNLHIFTRAILKLAAE